MSADPTGIYENRARQRKARRLAMAWAMFAPGDGPDIARDLDAIGRKALADLAGVPAPSDATWDMVVAALEDAEARALDRRT